MSYLYEGFKANLRFKGAKYNVHRKFLCQQLLGNTIINAFKSIICIQATLCVRISVFVIVKIIMN